MSDDLVKQLRYGIIEHRKRWSGDTHADLGGSVDYDATTDMLHKAADRIEELEADLRKMALDYLAAEGQAAEAYQAQLAAEAKLEKAVEECARIAQSHKPSADLLSDRYWRGVDEAAHGIAVEIYTTLAELKRRIGDE